MLQEMLGMSHDFVWSLWFGFMLVVCSPVIMIVIRQLHLSKDVHKEVDIDIVDTMDIKLIGSINVDMLKDVEEMEEV